MSNVIKIPLGVGRNNEEDPKVVGANTVELDNFMLNKEGVLEKRAGMGFAEQVTLSNRRIQDMVYWLDPFDETLWWLAWDRGSDDGSIPGHQLIRYKSDFSSEEILTNPIHSIVAEQIVFTGGTTNLTINKTLWTGVFKEDWYIKVTEGHNNPNPHLIEGSQDMESVNADTWDGGTSGTEYSWKVTNVTGPIMQTFKNGVSHGSTFTAPTTETQMADADNLKLSWGVGGTYAVDDTWTVIIYNEAEISFSQDDIDYEHSQRLSETEVDLEGFPGCTIICNDADNPSVDFGGTAPDKWKFSLTPIPHRVQMVNWGMAIRFPLGLYLNASIYQKINRNWFWMGTEFFKTFNDYHYDPINYPRIPDTFEFVDAEVVSGGDLQEGNVYSYKATAVYDGDQESLFNDKTWGPILTTATDKKFNLSLLLDADGINPRMTGVKIYRADLDPDVESGFAKNSQYQLVKTFDLTANLSDVYSISRSDVHLGRKMFGTVDWTNQTFANATDGKVGGIEQYWDYNDSQTLTDTWTRTEGGGIYGTFVLLGADSGQDKWNEVGNKVIYDNATTSNFGDKTCSNQSYWNFDAGSYFDWETGFNINPCGIGSGTAKPGDNEYWYNSSDCNGGIGEDWGGSTGNWVLLCYSDAEAVMSTGNHFLISTNWGYWRFCSSTSYKMRIQPRVEIIRDGNVIGTGNGFYSPYQSRDGRNDSNMNCDNFETWCKVPVNPILPTDEYRIKFYGQRWGNARYCCTYYSGSYYGGSVSAIIGVGTRQSYSQPDGGTTYNHKQMIAIPNSGLTAGQSEGTTITLDDGSVTDGYVISDHPSDDFMRSELNDADGTVAGWTGANSDTTNTITASSQAFENTTGSEIKINMQDDGSWGSGAYHQNYSQASMDTKYKYSTSLNGRNFVANVRITDQFGDSNQYDDMVMFSELAQPDVIPITNFIKLNDLQGGAIYGLGTIMSDLIVFAERGIYRINVPNSDPTSWSMIEAEPNLGCIQPESIMKYRNGLFFAGTDNFYYITPNWEFMPVADQWKTQYLEAISGVTETDRTSVNVDVNNKRLVMKCGTVNDIIHCLDLKQFEKGKLFWYNIKQNSSTEPVSDAFIIDNESNFKNLNLTNNGLNTKVTDLIGTTGGDTDQNHGENTWCLFKTGYISLANLGKDSVIIRYINIDMEYPLDDDLEVAIRINSDDTSLRGHYPYDTYSSSAPERVNYYQWDLIGNGNITTTLRKIRVSKRAKGFQLWIKTKDVSGNYSSYESDRKLIIKNIEIEIG